MFGTKKKLMTAVVMLVISAIMMTSASYAWFTISTKPEITDLTTQVVVNENLEIALAYQNDKLPENLTNPGRQYSWGNIIDLSETTFDTSGINKILRPATLSSGAPINEEFQFPYYGSDGRVNTMLKLIPSDGTPSDGFGNLVSTPSDGSKPYAYYVDFWVRSNVGGPLKLQTTAEGRYTGVASDGTSGSYFKSNKKTSADEVLAKNIYVAFKDITVFDSAYTDPAVNAVPVAVHQKNSGVEGTAEYTTTYDTDSSAIVTLKPNKAKLIRMYVYLEGKNVTNASASLGTNSGGSSGDLNGYKVGGSLNIQFAIAGVDESMNAEE